MDLGLWVVIGVILVGIALLLWQFRKSPPDDKYLHYWHNVGQGFYGSLAAVAIIVAGVLFLVEKQWWPRFAVDLKTDTFLLPRPGSKAAVIRVTIAIKNLGRTNQTINGIAVAADSLDYIASARPNRHGDLPGVNFHNFTSRKEKEIAPDETDYGFYEIPVSCDRRLVRVLVQVPQPPYRERPPGEPRPVYERKALVPLHSVCMGETSTFSTPFLDEGASLTAQE